MTRIVQQFSAAMWSGCSLIKLRLNFSPPATIDKHMSRAITITLKNPNLHRFRNFAEEVSLALDEKGWGCLPMKEADTAIDEIRIANVHTRKVRRALSLIDDLLKKHGFAGEAQCVVSRVQKA
ncbi:MAG TPA: hypothetical protein VGU20_29250 [Stellaceae bacterium]|nr:hypothetical protein [Stellaceae bacterium]